MIVRDWRAKLLTLRPVHHALAPAPPKEWVRRQSRRPAWRVRMSCLGRQQALLRSCKRTSSITDGVFNDFCYLWLDGHAANPPPL